jgi:2-iminobutanoate/2-iminopropanoate deaminase
MAKAKEAIHSDSAPAAVGPYAQAVAAGDWVFVSGQLGLEPASGRLVSGGAAAEARQALANVRAVLQAAGLELADVVRTTVYLADIGEFAAVNEVYGEFFSPPYPARVTVGVAALPRGARVEIEALAYRSKS